MNLKHLVSTIGILLFGLSVSQCTSQEDDRKQIARAGDAFLYAEDLEDLEIPGTGGQDSIDFVQSYINRWVKNQLLLSKAEYNLADQQKNFEQQIQDYRRDLLIFSYQQEYLKQHLDTNVSQEEMDHFFSENRDQFLLKENILKAEYAIIPVEAPKLDKAWEWFLKNTEKDKEKFHEYALKYAFRVSLEDSSWISYSQLAKIVPLPGFNEEDFLSRKKSVKFEDSTSVYMVRINAYKVKESQAPFAYSERTVRSILLNRKKLELLQQLEDKIYKDALRKNQVEVFGN